MWTQSNMSSTWDNICTNIQEDIISSSSLGKQRKKITEETEQNLSKTPMLLQSPIFLSPPHHPSISLHKLKSPSILLLSRARPGPMLARLSDGPEPISTTPPIADDGPIEISPSETLSIFATSEDPSTLQVATSVLLTGAISVFLFRSLRRRAKRAKELKFRSTGAKKSLKEEAIESLKAMTPTSPGAKGPPSAVQTLLGAISAGVIALILYKFATTVEASLNRQTISDNFSVRQITVTIRTIINGICYLATFVFGINSVGLFLYSGQLALNSIMEDFSSEDTQSTSKAQMSSEETESSSEESSKVGVNKEDQSSDST